MSGMEVRTPEPRTTTDATPVRDRAIDQSSGKEKLAQVVLKEKDDDGKDDTDEKKDAEKPLLDKENANKEVKISIESEGKTIDTPTLPLPTRKLKDVVEAPSMFLSPAARMRYEWYASSSLVEFFTKACCIIFASIGWLVLIGGAPLLSIVQLIIGSIYLNDCPVDPRIPEYLIVAGFFGTILHITALYTKYSPENKKSALQAHKRRCLCLEAILQVFLLIWFIAGCVWVYSIYEPEYDMVEHQDYCHKTVYLFAFWTFNITFVMLAGIVSIGICCIFCVAYAAKMEVERSKDTSNVTA